MLKISDQNYAHLKILKYYINIFSDNQENKKKWDLLKKTPGSTETGIRFFRKSFPACRAGNGIFSYFP